MNADERGSNQFKSAFIRVHLRFLVFFFFIAGCHGAQKPESPTGPHFSVLTYNVNFGGPRPDLAVDAIKSADADIVCLQETTPAWEEVIRANLGEIYAHISFHHAPAASGMAMLSKLPVRRTDYLKPEVGWFPAAVSTIETPLGDVQFLSVHLHPPADDRGSVAAGLLSTKMIRRNEIENFHTRAAAFAPQPSMARIVLGDFNESDDGRAVAWLKDKGYLDVLPAFAPDAKTWHWQWGLIPLSDRLDHILHAPDLHCFNARVLKRGASDHYPVLATFGVENRAAHK